MKLNYNNGVFILLTSGRFNFDSACQTKDKNNLL